VSINRFFGVSPARSTLALVIRGLLQTALFWVVFLILIPAAIMYLENKLGMRRFDVGGWRVAIVLAFLASGSTCVYCTWLFAKHGKGTPIPFEQPRELVIEGPYKFVRNPMAFGGIFQGMLVGAFIGSWITIVYALSGAVFWHFVAKPPEERDLAERFGDAYSAYRNEVRCWLPRLSPYQGGR
jgi:protein-S-isoprenylcysteine O-methyltransferase Ste14